MNNRKLLILHTEFIASRGGEKYVYELTQRISKKYTVSLYTERIIPYWLERFKKKHINVCTLWKPVCCYWLVLPITLLVNFFRLKKTVGKNSVVFATNFPLSLLGVLLSKNSILFCFEPLPIYYDRIRIRIMSLRAKLFVTVSKLLYQRLDEYAIRHATVLATLNTHVASYIKRRYQRTPDVYLPNRVDYQFFSPIKRRSPRDRFILLHSTDYTVLKGTELFIRSLPRVIQRYSNIEAWISESIHNPIEKEKYTALIQSLRLTRVVRFIGTVSEKQLPSFYRSGDVFCFLGSPYCAGGSTASFSVLEAQSCGTPVLRSFGGEVEIIDRKTGYYIHDYSEEGVAKEIIRFLQLPNSKKRTLSQAARNYIIKQFSWNKTVNTFAKTIEKMPYV